MLAFISISCFADTLTQAEFDCLVGMPTETMPLNLRSQLTHFQLQMQAMGLKVNMQEVLAELDKQKRIPTKELPVIVKSKPASAEELRRLMSPDFEAPNDASVLLLFHAPSSFSMRDCGANRASISSMASNNMVHGREMGDGRYQKVDTIGQTSELKFESGDCRSAISVSTRVFEVMGGAGESLFLYPVTDKFIENFHSQLGFDDPYLRKKEGFDKNNIYLRDPEGKEMTLKEGQIYLMPIRIKYDQYRRLMEAKNSKITLNAGMQVLLPIQKEYGQLAAGVHANLTKTDQISETWLASYSAGIALNVQSTVLGGYNYSDRKIDPSLNSALAVGLTRVDKDKKGSTSFVLSVGQSSPILDSKKYPEVQKWESFTSRQSAAAVFDVERSIALSLIRKSENDLHEVGVVEDFKNRQWRLNGNNNRDFSVYYKFTHQY